MRKIILAICTFCFTQVCIGQGKNEVLLHIPNIGKSISDFIPVNYNILDTVNCDFNNDGKKDIVMIVYESREDTAAIGSEIGGKDRILLVLFKTKIGWSLVAKSADIIMCKECGGVLGEPFVGMKIKNNILIIEHYGGDYDRWSYVRKAKYLNGDFYIIERTDGFYKAPQNCKEPVGEYTNVNFITGIRYRKIVSNDCKVLLDKKDKIEKLPLVKLTEYKY